MLDKSKLEVGDMIKVFEHECRHDTREPENCIPNGIYTVTRISSNKNLGDADWNDNHLIFVNKEENCYVSLNEADHIDLECTCGVGVCTNCKQFRRN